MSDDEYPTRTKHSLTGAGRKKAPPVRQRAGSVRLPCGHYSPDGKCDDPECANDSPDPWDLASDPGLFNRMDETRHYRQTTYRMRKEAER